MASKDDNRLQTIRDERSIAMSDAALTLFAQKGFATTKISEITSAAKASHGLFYHYFKSKEDLYQQIINDILDTFILTVKKAEERAGSPYDQLTWFTEITYTASLKEGLRKHILITQAFQADCLANEFKQMMKDKYARAIEGIKRIIERGQEEGCFIEGDPLELAVYYQSLNHGLTLWNAKGIQPIDICADKVLRYLTP